MTVVTLPERYLTPEEVVQVLRLPSVETLYQWRRKHIGPPASKTGKHLRYHPAKLAQWMESRESQEI